MKKERVRFEAKDEYYISNGAILLEKQISSYGGKGHSFRIFSAKEIERATNNYDNRLILGKAIATVYKGTLDDHDVAIKTPLGLNPSDQVIDFFLNQVAVKLNINHKNVVKLLGCCLETQIPMLVYEFMSNGALFDHLHGKGQMGPRWISWLNRLSIASDIAYALCCMHCASSKPIVHRDVKSANIFLNEDYTAKISNFGISVSILPQEPFIVDENHEYIIPTYAYVDPEYLETRRVTDKCDVYAFGVVLIELMTGKNPRIDLVNCFVWLKREQPIVEIVEGRILAEANREQIEAFGELALRCVRDKGEERPAMKEVVQELWKIQKLESLTNSM